jgi:hypothetical protein
MTPTAPDVASLAKSLSCWEWIEYISAFAVMVACAGEYIAGFVDRFAGGDEERKRRLTKGSTLLLVIALSCEPLALFKTNQISGELTGSIAEQAKLASDSAEKALNDSNSSLIKSTNAATLAGQATTASGRAADESSKAEGAASNAQELSRSASQQVDSLRVQTSALTVDIKQAKRDAADLSKQLAETEAAVRSRNLDQQKFASELRTIAPVPVKIETISDFEARRAGLVIKSALALVWPKDDILFVIRTDPASDVKFFFPGVSVTDTCGPTNPHGADFASFKRCVDTEKAVMKALDDSGIHTEQVPPTDESEIPQGSLLIRVGLRPMPGEREGAIILQ